MCSSAGYAARSGACKVFSKAMDGGEADAVDQHRAIEVQRLDSLQVGLWDTVVSGDAKAVNAVLRIINQRSRLRGSSPRPRRRGRAVWWVRRIGSG